MQSRILSTALIAATISILAVAAAKSQDCPPGARSCKIVTMTDDEISTLTGKGAIFDSAVYANKMNVENIIGLWKQKIEQSPNGKVNPPAAAPAQGDAK